MERQGDFEKELADSSQLVGYLRRSSSEYDIDPDIWDDIADADFPQAFMIARDRLRLKGHDPDEVLAPFMEEPTDEDW